MTGSNAHDMSRWDGLANWGERPERQRWVHKNVLFPEYLSLVESYGSRKVLDYGCGDGALSAFLIASCSDIDIVAFDESENMRRLARLALGRMSVPDDLGSMQFDTICMNMVLQDALEPECLLASLKRRLGDSGRLIISVPHPIFSLIESNHRTTRRERISPSRENDIMRYIFEEPEKVHWSDDGESWTHLYNRTIQTYSSIFCRAGFSIAEIREPLARGESESNGDLFRVYNRAQGS